MNICKKFSHATLFFVAVFVSFEGLIAEDVRNSITLLGGGAKYRVTEHRDPEYYASYKYLADQWTDPADPVRMMSDVSLAQPPVWEGSGSVGRLQYERLFFDSKSLGLTVGAGFGKIKEKCIKNCGDWTDLLIYKTFNELILTPANLSSSSSGFYMLFLLPSLLSVRESGYSYTTLDVGLNYHASADSFLDPYAGLFGGYGTCSLENVTGMTCNIGRYGARLGMAINLTNRFFLLAQAEIERVEMNVTGEDGGGKLVLPVPDKHLMAGLGFRF